LAKSWLGREQPHWAKFRFKFNDDRRYGKGLYRQKYRQFSTLNAYRMTDATALEEDQANRKQRLLKGPEEFRETRVDRPKVKGK
jgi:hypothetical protein